MKIRSSFFALGAFLVGLSSASAQATWTGLGSDANWTDPSNWLAGVVPLNDSMTFLGTADFSSLGAGTSTIDTSYSLNSLTFQNTSPVVLNASNSSTLTFGGILHIVAFASSSTVDIDLPILGTANIWLNGGAGGTLTLNGGNGGSTYTGDTRVYSGNTLADGGDNSYSPYSLMNVGGTGGGTLLINYNEAVAGLNDGGANGVVKIASGKTLTLDGMFSASFSGTIIDNGGPGNVVIVGPSQATFLGSSTYTGTTTIDSGGGLILGGTAGSITSDVSSSTNGAISFGRSNAYTFANLLSGTLTVVQSGTGTTTLTANNTYSGSTVVNAGTLQAGSNNAFGNGLSSVSIASGGTFDLNGWDNSIGTLALALGGSVNLGGGTLTIDSPGGTSIINGVITGSGGRVTTNSYQVVVANGNTYTGQTTIGGGTFEANNASGYANGAGGAQVLITPTGILQIGGSNTNGYIDPASLVIDNGKVTFARTDAITFANDISGSGGMEKVSGGTVTLTGANSFSGLLEMFTGTLLAGAGNTSAFGSGDLVQFDSAGATLNLNNNNESVGSITGGSAIDSILLGSGHLTLTDGTANTNTGAIIQGTGVLSTNEAHLVVYGANTYSGGTIVSGGTLIADNPSGSATGTGSIQLMPGSVLQIGSFDANGAVAAGSVQDNGTIVFDRSDATNFNSNITGTGGIELDSPVSGAVTLTGNNTYSGPTDIEYLGQLYAGSSNAFGNGFSALIINNGGLLIMNGHNLAFGSLTGDMSGQIQTGGATLTTGSSNTTTNFGGTISGTGGLVKMGTGTQILSGFNNYNGTTLIQQGALADGQANSFSSSSPFSLGGSLGGSLSVNFDETIQTINDYMSIPGSIYLNSGATLTVTGTTNTAATITGAGGLTVNVVASSLTLGGANSYYGDTIVNQGTLADGIAGAFSPNSAVYVNSGAGLVANLNEAVGNLESSTPGGTVSIAGTFSSMGLNYVSDFQGVISGPGQFLVLGGIQGLSGNNNYSGGTTVMNGAELFVGSDNALGTGTVFFDASSEFSPDANVTIANPIVLVGGEVLDNDDGGSNNMTLTGLISETGGVGSITWCAPGTLTLTNANTFTGGVDMREGTLVTANNLAAGTGTITLDTGAALNVRTGVTTSNPINFNGGAATLTGSGTIAAAITAGPSVIIAPAASPGNGPGTLTFSSALTLAPGGTINFNLYDATGAAGTGYSLISAGGGLDLTATAGSFTVNVSSINATGGAAAALNFSGGTAYSWTFISSTGITGFNANQFSFVSSNFQNSIGAGFFSVSQSGNNLMLDFTPVPEPSTWCFIGGGAAMLLYFHGRRKRLVRA